MLKPNSAFEQFSRRTKETLFRPWKGTIYRVTTLKYAGARTILFGEGSYRNGGRWNAIGSFRAVYGSTNDVVALAESKANAEYANLAYPFRETRLLVAVDVVLSRVVDLTVVENFGNPRNHRGRIATGGLAQGTRTRIRKLHPGARSRRLRR